MTDYDKVLQAIKEMRPVQNNPLVRENPPSWWLDRFEEAVIRLKENNV